MTPIQIDVSANGVMKAVAAMNRLLASGKALQQYQGGPGGGGASSGGSSSANPLVRLQQSQVQLQRLLQQQPGNTTAIFGAQYRAALAQQAFSRAQTAVNGGPSLMSRLSGFISSSRFSVGPGGLQIMPLVGRLMGLLGRSGPIGAIVAGTILVLTTFATAVHRAAESLNELRSAALVSGGSSGNISALTGMGFNPGQAASAAQEFSALSASNGFAAFLRAQAGAGQNVGGPFGEINKAAPLEKVLKYIASLNTLTERQRAAMEGQLTAYLPLIEAYRRHKSVMDADAQATAAVNSAQAGQDASDLMVQLGRLGASLQLLLNSVLKPFMPTLAAFIGGLADWVRDTAMWINAMTAAYSVYGHVIAGILDAFNAWAHALRMRFMDLFSGIYTSLSEFINNLIDKLPDPLKKGLDGMRMPSWGDLVDPLNNLANAMNANTDATKAATAVFAPGTYGGGSAVRGAVPSKWTRFDTQTQVSIWNAHRLGAFAMG